MVVSVLVHGIVLFGISFILPTQAENRSPPPPMTIMLVAAPPESEPDFPKALAQSNRDGTDVDEQQPWAMATKARRPAPAEPHRILSVDRDSSRPAVRPRIPSSDMGDTRPVDRAELRHHLQSAHRHTLKNTRKRFVHARSKASELAPYLEKWRLLVERVGNLHYPEAARRDNLEGELVLDVAVRADGSVADMTVLRSSGHWVLDDSAEHIVRIAAPFDPFPDRLRRDYDILHIIRTWKFSQNTLTDVTR